MKLSSILGLNARSQLFSYPFNTLKGKRIADSKLQTAKVLAKNGIFIPTIFKKFNSASDVYSYDWTSLPSSFALKPSRGLGGEGIIVVKKRAVNPVTGRMEKDIWVTTQRQQVGVDDLKLHTIDVLEGAYSIGNIPDVCFVQEYVGRHKAFRKYAFRGTPDIRIIIFNKVPVMAMLRLPTRESGGRANLHQGAIGVGIDVATGITTKAIWHEEHIRRKPGTNRKLHGIKVPNWTKILEMAVNAQIASGLGYLGVDVVLHPERGPMVLELNAQPGLQIQLANMEGLKKRLERVEDLKVKDAEHGVKIAKALFAERFADRVKAEEGIKTINSVEEIKVVSVKGEKIPVMAKIDTGAWASSIDKVFAGELGIYQPNKVLWYKKTISALGREKRPVINVNFWLAGRKIRAAMTVSNRKNLTYKVNIGRTELAGFLVSAEIPKI